MSYKVMTGPTINALYLRPGTKANPIRAQTHALQSSPQRHLSARILNTQDEVMTRRYGWRAVLKVMKIEGTHKGSEVEIKILPVNALTKLKQASRPFRL